jgi:hypothetical protein
MARKSTPVDNWMDKAVEIPRTEAASNKDRSKRQKFYRRYITAAIVLLPFTLVANVFLLGNVSNKPVATTEAVATSSEGRAAATLAVREWLSGKLSPLPGLGSIVSWDGAKVIPKPTQTADQKQQNPLPDYQLEVDSFTVVDGLRSTYTVAVQVALSRTSGAYVLGSPSAIPVAGTDAGTFAGATPWFGLGTAQTPGAVGSAIDGWATAFTSGDPNALRLSVQDSTGSDVYVPLSNVASKTLEIKTAAYIRDPNSDPKKSVTTSSVMVVQVELSILWTGMPALQSGDKLPTVAYDLLVHKVNGGAPVVVAWGAPGSGPTLKEFGNAITGAKAIPAPKASDKPNPSSTPTPSSSPKTVGSD